MDGRVSSSTMRERAQLQSLRSQLQDVTAHASDAISGITSASRPSALNDSLKANQSTSQCRLPVSHDRVSPMKNPPRGGTIILCKSLSPYANLAYPMTKSPPPLKFRRSRRYTIAPREVFAPAARLIAYWTMVSQHGSDGVPCYKKTEVDCGWSNTTSFCMVRVRPSLCQTHN